MGAANRKGLMREAPTVVVATSTSLSTPPCGYQPAGPSGGRLVLSVVEVELRKGPTRASFMHISLVIEAVAGEWARPKTTPLPKHFQSMSVHTPRRQGCAMACGLWHVCCECPDRATFVHLHRNHDCPCQHC
jgi:hypothetical protein